MIELEHFPARVIELLESRWPAAVDRESILVTGESSWPTGVDHLYAPPPGTSIAVQIVLIPHRQLGGFCLGVWADPRGIEMIWSWVTDLSTHDQLDLGLRVARIHWEPNWHARLQQQLFRELERPIVVVVRRRLLSLGVYCSVEFENKEHRSYIGRAPAHIWDEKLRRWSLRNRFQSRCRFPWTIGGSGHS
jgi:hypothetical protein